MNDTLVDTISTLGGLSTALLAISGLLWGAYKLFKKFIYIQDAVSTLKPNGGNSTADKINKILVKLENFDERLKTLEEGGRKKWFKKSSKN